MYKKRIRTWGLHKNVKADTKEKAILGLVGNASVETITTKPIRYDKLVRYAKSRTKSGSFDSHTLNRIIQHESFPGLESPETSFRIVQDVLVTDTSGTATVPYSLPSENNLSNLELFLKAMSSVIVKERAEWLKGQHHHPSSILDALTKGIALSRDNNITAACRSFRRAARDTTQDLQNKYVTRICYCISSLVWGSTKDPHFDRFTHFLARSAVEKLGHGNPLTVLLQHLPGEKSFEAQLAMWACALDDYEISEQNIDHWWSMAQRRWRWCRRSGRLDLAERYCTYAMSEAHRINKLTSDKESEARQDLETIKLTSGT